ncbi:hypothetical protein NQ318_015969, partial [Aromia moschata]
MSHLENEMTFEIANKVHETYINFLKKAILENNHQTIDTILEKIKIYHEKIQIDIFINQLDEIFHKECFSTLSLYTIKQVVKRHYPLLGSFYRLYLTKLLIGKDDYLQIDHLNKYYPSFNITLNYKNIDWSLDKAICEAVYFTQHSFLENIYRVIIRNNVNYKFDLENNEEHKQLMQWLSRNIVKGSGGAPVGWSCGPDSGKWPATTLEDYIKTE